MFKIVEAKPLADYRLWVRFEDGVEGEIDLSQLVGKGVFTLWDDAQAFQKVRIGECGQLAWDEQIELCPDAVYMQVSGKKPEDLFPNLNETEVNA